MAQCVAYQAHTAHDEEYADGCGAEGQAEDGCEGVVHEVEFCKGGKEQVVEVHGVWCGAWFRAVFMRRTSRGFPVAAFWRWLGRGRILSEWSRLRLPQFFRGRAAGYWESRHGLVRNRAKRQ